MAATSERGGNVAQLADQLERAILTGEYATGDLLPSERDLSERFGVSRSVVREALGRLASLGLVRSVHGSGTRVEAPSSRAVTVGYQRLLHRPDFRLEHLGEVRLALETTIAAAAARSRTPAHLEQLQATQSALGDAGRTLEEHVEADLAFHATLAEATGNPLFATVLVPIQQLLIERGAATLGRYGAELALAHHAAILAAVEAGDAVGAEAAMRRHLEANFQHLHEVGAESPDGAAG